MASRTKNIAPRRSVGAYSEFTGVGLSPLHLPRYVDSGSSERLEADVVKPAEIKSPTGALPDHATFGLSDFPFRASKPFFDSRIQFFLGGKDEFLWWLLSKDDCDLLFVEADHPQVVQTVLQERIQRTWV